METRLKRLSGRERGEALTLMETLNDSAAKDKSAAMARLGELISKADSYDPLPHNGEVLEYQYDTYQAVWEQARELRSRGKLLGFGKRIRCPIVALHGDYDPHPSEGVRAPLSRLMKDFRLILLTECGHYPWLERRARDRFYDILKNEI